MEPTPEDAKDAMDRLHDVIPRPDRWEVYESILWALCQSAPEALVDAIDYHLQEGV